MAMKRITRRWLFNSLGVILVILVAIEIAFAVGIRSFYYNNVRQAINSRANVVSTLLVKSYEDIGTDYLTEVRNSVENFTDKDKMELMAIDPAGNVLITSSGFEPAGRLYMPDFEAAVNSPTLTGEFQGTIDGENIFAITYLSPVPDDQVAAMRFVVSLTDVDRQIYLFITLFTLVVVAIIFFVVLSSSYFINSIVIPVGDVGQTARRIAQGDFNARLEKKTDDEIGELCDIINYMAEELSTAEHMKNDFISSVSHELRTPLTAIKGWGETLLDDSIDRDTYQKGIHVIIGETERLSQMVEELLDFSRIQSGRLKLIMTRMDLLAELGDAVLMFTERAKREGIQLIYDEPELFVPVYGDKNRLRQVFVNILDNAIKYSDSGDTVTITARVSDSFAVISIADTGCGISREDLPNIKTKFYKGNTTRRGSGIGLAVADEIISMHGGSIEIRSRKGFGTTVVIRIPIMKKSEEMTQIANLPESTPPVEAVSPGNDPADKKPNQRG